MPRGAHQLPRDNNPILFADWVAAEDHFGPLPPSSGAITSAPASPESPQVSTPQVHSPRPSRASSVQASPWTPRRALADASTQTPGRPEPITVAERQPQPHPQPLQPQRSAASRPAFRPPSPSRSQRSRDQVGRDSYQLLWREYLSLTSEPDLRQPQPRRRSHSASDTGASPSPQQLASMASPAPVTVLQAPLSYEKPKGLGAVLLPLLCPPTDFADMQRLTKHVVKLVVQLSTLLVSLSFVLVPAWLWLIRHELLLGHRGDAAAVTFGGVLLFLAADAAKSASARAAAVRRNGVFTSATQSAYQVAPGHFGGSGGSGAPAAAASKPAGASATAGTAPSAAAAGARGLPAGGAAPAVTSRGAAPTASAADPVVRQVKQRIMKLELLLFGNELTEADISRDALHNRVQTLCTEVGVPFGGPGGSSAKPSTAELDAQLQAVEKALGV